VLLADEHPRGGEPHRQRRSGVYLQEGHDLAWLQAELAPLREQARALLHKGARGRHTKTANFCAGLLEEYEALWTFCEIQGIDPTNYADVRVMPMLAAGAAAGGLMWSCSSG